MTRSVRLRVAATLLLALVAAAIAVAQAPAAMASCIGNPPPSPYSFTGVVVRTDLGQRIAYVTTDDGRDVVVRGTSATVENGFTTVDRSYVTGHRYVFHPVNGSSPYEDNICTATYDLGLEPTTRPAAASPTAETELADGTDGPGVPRTWLLVGAVAGVALLVTGVVLVRRTRTDSPEGTSTPDGPT